MAPTNTPESMRLYAEDAFQTTEPWVRWEFSEDGARWCQHIRSTWSIVLQYRRKAGTITVDGVELPAPETEAPAYGTKIYFINPFNRSVVESCWSGARHSTSTLPKEQPDLPCIGTTLSNGLTSSCRR